MGNRGDTKAGNTIAVLYTRVKALEADQKEWSEKVQYLSSTAEMWKTKYEKLEREHVHLSTENLDLRVVIHHLCKLISNEVP